MAHFTDDNTNGFTQDDLDRANAELDRRIDARGDFDPERDGDWLKNEQELVLMSCEDSSNSETIPTSRTYRCPECDEDRDCDDTMEAACPSCGVCGVCSETHGGHGSSEYCERCAGSGD